LLTLARYDVGSPTAGQDAELGAIAAVVIGGGSLFGGEGGVGGTIIGAIFVSSLVTGLVLAGVNPNWQEISVGLLIIGGGCNPTAGRGAEMGGTAEETQATVRASESRR